MEELILFTMCFIFVLIMYELFLIGPLKKNKSKKELLEVRYLITVYHLDKGKVNYNQLLQICAITSSFVIAVVVSLVSFVKGLLLELLVGFLGVTILIFLSYHLIYIFYKKKGMINNGKHK